MRRGLLALLILIAPVATALFAAGCEQKVTTIDKSERIEETPPEMVSPGEPVLE